MYACMCVCIYLHICTAFPSESKTRYPILYFLTYDVRCSSLLMVNHIENFDVFATFYVHKMEALRLHVCALLVCMLVTGGRLSFIAFLWPCNAFKEHSIGQTTKGLSIQNSSGFKCLMLLSIKVMSNSK